MGLYSQAAIDEYTDGVHESVAAGYMSKPSANTNGTVVKFEGREYQYLDGTVVVREVVPWKRLPEAVRHAFSECG